MEKLNPYIRIMRGAERGRGVILSAEDVWYLSQDSAIEAVASRTSEGGTSESGGYIITKTGFVDKDSSQ